MVHQVTYKLIIMKELKVNQKIEIGRHIYQIDETSGGKYFLFNCSMKLNGAIFDDLNIKDGYKFASDILGYPLHRPESGRSFPFVRTLEDLTKVVEKLQRLSNQDVTSNIITLQQFRDAMSNADICGDWTQRLSKELGNNLLFDGKVDVAHKTITDMYCDANGTQMKLLDELFPNYDANPVISCNELKVGEVMEIVSNGDHYGGWLMRGNSSFTELTFPYHIWSCGCQLEGKRIKVKITLDEE